MMKLADLKTMQADLWFFDNDGTLYDDSRIAFIVEGLMDQFFARLYNIGEHDGKLLRKQLKCKHGVTSTVVALHREKLPVEKFIQETYLAVNFCSHGVCLPTTLANLVPHILGEKIVLTNNPSEFAWRVLDVLGLEKEFATIYGVHELNYFSKPSMEAFAPIILAVQQGKRVVFIDDKVQNLLALKGIGSVTRLFWNGTDLVMIGGIHDAK